MTFVSSVGIEAEYEKNGGHITQSVFSSQVGYLRWEILKRCGNKIQHVENFIRNLMDERFKELAQDTNKMSI